jgi:hypothetical protein
MRCAFSPTLFAIVFGLLTAAMAQNFEPSRASPSGTSFGAVQSNPLESTPTGSPLGGSVSNPLTQQYMPTQFEGGEPRSEHWMAPSWQHYALFGSILLLSLSLYLFFESIALHRFAFRGMEDAPKAKSGLLLVVLSVATLVIYLALLQMTQLIISEPRSRADFGQARPENFFEWGMLITTFFVFHYPLAAVPGIALASLLPSVLAVYKFLVASSVLRRREDAAAPANVGRAFVGIWIGAINFLASVVTLISFWRLAK